MTNWAGESSGREDSSPVTMGMSARVMMIHNVCFSTIITSTAALFFVFTKLVPSRTSPSRQFAAWNPFWVDRSGVESQDCWKVCSLSLPFWPHGSCSCYDALWGAHEMIIVGLLCSWWSDYSYFLYMRRVCVKNRWDFICEGWRRFENRMLVKFIRS